MTPAITKGPLSVENFGIRMIRADVLKGHAVTDFAKRNDLRLLGPSGVVRTHYADSKEFFDSMRSDSDRFAVLDPSIQTVKEFEKICAIQQPVLKDGCFSEVWKCSRQNSVYKNIVKPLAGFGALSLAAAAAAPPLLKASFEFYNEEILNGTDLLAGGAVWQATLMASAFVLLGLAGFLQNTNLKHIVFEQQRYMTLKVAKDNFEEREIDFLVNQLIQNPQELLNFLTEDLTKKSNLLLEYIELTRNILRSHEDIDEETLAWFNQRFWIPLKDIHDYDLKYVLTELRFLLSLYNRRTIDYGVSHDEVLKHREALNEEVKKMQKKIKKIILAVDQTAAKFQKYLDQI